MKKTMIATAVAAAFALPMAAQAEVTVYGKAHNYIVSVDATGNGTDNTITTTEAWMVRNSSRIGFKGSEDLGGGLHAIWKYEMTYDTDEAGAIGSGRNSYVGLAGSFGTFLVGRHDTPYKMAWYAGGADFGDNYSIADMNGAGAGGDGVGHTHFDETRANNAIVYVSPDMTGLKAAVAIIPGEDSAADNNGLADTYSVGLMYAGGGLKVGAGFERGVLDMDSSLTPDPDTTAAAFARTVAPSERRWHITGSYTYSNFSLGASYADVKDDANISGDEKTSLGLGAQAKFGKNTVGVNWRNSDIKDASANDGEVDSWAFFLAHALSKRTSVYAAVGQHTYEEDSNSNADQETNEYGVGVYHSF